LVGLYPGACFSSQEMNVLEGIFWFHARWKKDQVDFCLPLRFTCCLFLWIYCNNCYSSFKVL
jgi:hypothetical protein